MPFAIVEAPAWVKTREDASIWIIQNQLGRRNLEPYARVELVLKLESDEKDNVLLVDVRSHGYYDEKAARIKGSIRIEPNNFEEELKNLPHDKDLYLYCT